MISISHASWFLPKKYRSQNSRKRGLGRKRGLRLKIMGLMDMVVVEIDKSFLDKAFLIILSISMVGCLPLGLNGKVVSPYAPLVLGMVRGMRITVWPVSMVAMGVVRVET